MIGYLINFTAMAKRRLTINSKRTYVYISSFIYKLLQVFLCDLLSCGLLIRCREYYRFSFISEFGTGIDEGRDTKEQ